MVQNMQAIRPQRTVPLADLREIAGDLEVAHTQIMALALGEVFGPGGGEMSGEVREATERIERSLRCVRRYLADRRSNGGHFYRERRRERVVKMLAHVHDAGPQTINGLAAALGCHYQSVGEIARRHRWFTLTPSGRGSEKLVGLSDDGYRAATEGG